MKTITCEYISCKYRTENCECELTNDDCFPDDIPWSCPLMREVKKNENR